MRSLPECASVHIVEEGCHWLREAAIIRALSEIRTQSTRFAVKTLIKITQWSSKLFRHEEVSTYEKRMFSNIRFDAGWPSVAVLQQQIAHPLCAGSSMGFHPAHTYSRCRTLFGDVRLRKDKAGLSNIVLAPD